MDPIVRPPRHEVTCDFDGSKRGVGMVPEPEIIVWEYTGCVNCRPRPALSLVLADVKDKQIGGVLDRVKSVARWDGCARRLI